MFGSCSRSGGGGPSRYYFEGLGTTQERINKTGRLLAVPNAERVPVGGSVASCAEMRPRQLVVRHVGGFLSADGRQDHDTSHRVSRARQMVGMIAGAWVKGQKDRRGRSSPLSLPLRLKIMQAHVEPILTTFCRSRPWTKAQLQQVKRAQAYALRRAFEVDRLLMQGWHLSGKAMLQAAEWEPIDDVIRSWRCMVGSRSWDEATFSS